MRPPKNASFCEKAEVNKGVLQYYFIKRKQPLNQLKKALSEISDTYRLREKILIVPSFSHGHQITESLVKNGIPYINLRIKTFSSLAHETIDLALAKESINFLSETSTYTLKMHLDKKTSGIYASKPLERRICVSMVYKR